jgi:tetratricopeptide (TPR) repeat protein
LSSKTTIRRAEQTLTLIKIAINDPCPCGSGKKYKKCCQGTLGKVSSSETSTALTKQLDPAEANKLIGLLHAGEHAQLERHLNQHQKKWPDNGVLWKIRGVSLQMQHKDGLAALQKAAELLPSEADAHSNLGNALRALKRFDEASVSYRRAISLKPDFAEAYNNLGNALFEMRQHQAAEEAYREAIRFAPEYAQAHNNLGFLLQAINRFDEALACCENAVRLSPNYPNAYTNLGIVLHKLERFEDALEVFQRGLVIAPCYADCRASMAGVLIELGRPDQALIECNRALRDDPRSFASYLNIGMAHYMLGRFDKAVDFLNKALDFGADKGVVGNAMGYVLFSMGDIARGWEGYDHRFASAKMRPFDSPTWAGEDLSGKTLLIWGEQGVGDEIFFASLFGKALNQAQRCVIECGPKLQPLFARSFPGAVVVASSEPPHPATANAIDYQCAAGSLGRWLCPTLDQMPRQHRYLTPDAARLAYWRARIAGLGTGLKIGICWRSSINRGNRLLQYSTLDQWGALFQLPGVHFVNLQYDECTAELEHARQQFDIALHHYPEVDMYDDLDETSALIASLDVVIGAGTAVTALSVALGVPTCQMSFGQIFSTFGTPHDGFAANLHHFSRQLDQDWTPVIEQIAAQLAHHGVPVPVL